MPYIWESKNWPNFTWDSQAVEANNYSYALTAGRLAREAQSLSEPERRDAVIDLMVTEARKTSWIEGEDIDPEAIRSSILKQLGLIETDYRRDPHARGIARLMTATRSLFAEPLSKERLWEWHKLFMGATLEDAAGKWRKEPSWIVSGVHGKEKVHYQAPPAARVPEEMAKFIHWFNASPSLPGPVRAGVAHLYFESIHPFADGNGRMGRAIADIALSQELRYPAFISLSNAIDDQRKSYYAALQHASNQLSMDITGWLNWWTRCVRHAQENACEQIAFAVKKSVFWKTRGHGLNARQEKALKRMLRAGPAGFAGGMSTQKYARLTRCSKRTAARDLRELVNKGALETLPGGGRSTRYALQLPARPTPGQPISPNQQ